MVRLKSYRINSSTLVENLVALVIISFCLGVVLLVTANLTKDLNQKEYRTWLNQIRQISLNQNEFLIRKEIQSSNLEILFPLQNDSINTRVNLYKIRKYEN